MADLVVITGSSGRIGKRLIQRLEGKYQIVGIDFHPPAFKPSHLSFLFADLSDDSSVKTVFEKIRKEQGEKIASFIHLAAYYDFVGGSWDKYEEITLKGTSRLLKELQNFSVEQFIFSSTLLVHKPTKPGQKIGETSPLAPAWAYPKSKVLTEQIIEKEKGNIPSVILRIAGCYDENCHSIPISQMIQRIYEKDIKGHLFPGDKQHGASFLHFEDLTECLCLVIEKRKELGEEIFLVGEEKTYSYDQLQNEIGRLLYNKPWFTLRIPKWVAKAGAFMQLLIPSENTPFIKPWMIDLADDHYELDLSHIREKLKWSPKKDLFKALSNMVEKLQESPELWYREQGLSSQNIENGFSEEEKR